MGAFDRLERQLLDSVGLRSRTSRRNQMGRLPDWWRQWIGPGASALAASLVAVVAALAMWAGPGPRVHGPSERPTSNSGERSCVPCQAFGGRLHGGRAAGGAGAVTAVVQSRDRRGLSVVRWAQEQLSAAAGETPRSAG